MPFDSQSQAPRLLVAMDFDSADACLALADQLNPKLCRLKVGKELFTLAGPDLVRRLADQGFDIFLDLKYHDIPNTVAKAVRAAAGLGVWMVNVHASGGRRMLEASRDALDSVPKPPLLIAVTVLTSMTDDDLAGVNIPVPAWQQVEHLAQLAKHSGMDGVVCSAQEAASLKKHCGEDFCLVTPGIRPAGAASDDQRRIVTPAQAIANGSDYLVVGRPITQAEDPAFACEQITLEIDQALAQ